MSQQSLSVNSLLLFRPIFPASRLRLITTAILPGVLLEIVLVVPELVPVQTTMQKFPHQPQRQQRQRQHRRPAPPSRAHERGEDGGNDDGLGNCAPNPSPPTENCENGEGGAGGVEEEGGDGVVAPRRRLEELLQ